MSTHFSYEYIVNTLFCFVSHLFLVKILPIISLTFTGRRVQEETTQVSKTHLVVSGSRAVGGITCERTNTFHLFDFEEDEDDDDDSDE